LTRRRVALGAGRKGFLADVMPSSSAIYHDCLSFAQEDESNDGLGVHVALSNFAAHAHDPPLSEST
jgi:hypothetical protein